MSKLEKAPPGWTPWDAFDNCDDTRNILDGTFNGMPRSELYRSQVFPDLFPHERPMMVNNWSVEDREMFCGGEYTKGYN